MEQNRIEDLVRRLMEGLPPSLRAAQKDLETNLRGALRTGLSKLDMVTREEFDAQARVLERSREMVEALERRIAELEARLEAGMGGAAAPPPAPPASPGLPQD
jgi:BMFP domain-containing protein YqiC